TRWPRDWSSDVCSSDLVDTQALQIASFLTALIDVEGPGAQIETTARHDGRAAQATEKRTAGAHGSLRGGFPIRSSFVRSYCSPRSEEHTSELQSRGHLV